MQCPWEFATIRTGNALSCDVGSGTLPLLLLGRARGGALGLGTSTQQLAHMKSVQRWCGRMRLTLVCLPFWACASGLFVALFLFFICPI